MRARSVGALVCAALVLLPVSIAAAEPGDSDAESERRRTVLYEGPNAVTVPYLGEAETVVADGWRITDCDAVARGSDLIVGCSEAGFVARADSYDPRYGHDIVDVPMTNGRTTTTMQYVVQLEPPEAPDSALARYPNPAPAGGVLMIPLSDLAIDCAACEDGGRVEAFSVAPAGAADVSVTETHVIVRARAEDPEDLEIVLRVADQFGGWSQQIAFRVPVSSPSGDPLRGLAVFHEMPGRDGTTIAVDDLVVGDADRVTVIGCGEALDGTVSCGTGDGVRYRPGGADVDQVSVQLARGADQATASITFVRAGDDAPLPTDGVVPTVPLGEIDWASTAELESLQSAEDERQAEEDESEGAAPEGDADQSDAELIGMRVSTPMPFPQPPAEQTGEAGMFAVFREILDRVGRGA
ncbi:hypothetical protein [Microbacterium karelineae]|uniref:hypothetical protein n=1 Tax=Microbacterium karelineae TaxID=2654283 RepID=UPI0012E9FD64|nr:hypothetical protein [Microbacterium karelineae]